MGKLIILAVVFTLAGCGSTYEFGREPGQISAQEAFAVLDASDVTLKLRDGRIWEGQVKSLSDSSLEFLQTEDSALTIVRPGQVHSIVVSGNRVAPTVLGGLAGAALGGWSGSFVKDQPSRGIGPSLNGHDVAIGLGIFFGTCIGATAGYATVPKTRIIFPIDSFR